jgi:hypothetical protein
MILAVMESNTDEVWSFVSGNGGFGFNQILQTLINSQTCINFFRPGDNSAF